MITTEELRKIVILGRLNEPMLEKVAPLIERRHFEEGEAIFREGDTAEHFFMLRSGKVLLEARLTDKMTVSIDSIKPGYSFGWSAMLSQELGPYSTYTSDAICAETCEVFAANGDQFQDMLEADHDMGYILTKRLNVVVKQRLVHRTEQFIRLIKRHPDIHNLINK